MKNNKKTFYVLLAVVLLAGVGLWYSGLLPNQNAEAAVIQFNNNNQNLANAEIVFGPNIRSEDGRTIFDTSKTGLWNKLSEKFTGVELNMLMIDQEGDLQNVDSTTLSAITMTDQQMQALASLQDTYDFTVTLSSGSGLNKFCDETNAARHGRLAAQLEAGVVSHLIDQGVRVDAYNVDGPFLSLIQGSHKFATSATQTPASPANANGEGSCWLQGYNKTSSEAATIVATYMDELQSLTAVRQNDHEPKMNLVINLPNWRIGSWLEMHWGTEPMRNVWPLHTVLTDFAATEHPDINTVVIDYPYGLLIGSNIFTKHMGQSSYNNCYNGPFGNIPCAKVTPTESFAGKVTELTNYLDDLNGTPDISFYVNTTAESNLSAANGGKGLPACAEAEAAGWRSNRSPALIPFENNRCFDGVWPFADSDQNGVPDSGDAQFNESDIDTPTEADQDQADRDKNYLHETIQYYHTIKSYLPSGVDVDNLYFHSWHVNPRYSASFGVQVVNFIESNYVPN